MGFESYKCLLQTSFKPEGNLLQQLMYTPKHQHPQETKKLHRVNPKPG